MNKIFRLACLWVALALSPLAHAQIFIPSDDFRMPHPLPHPRPHPEPWSRQWAPLEISSVKINARIEDQVAKTSLNEELYNPSSQRLEGTFLFPVPRGAQIDKFTMEIDGKQVEAEMMTSEKARSIYEDIVRRLRDPALLEYADRDLFKVRIFPIEPHGTKRVTLSYTQLLKSDAGVVNYVFPLNTEKFSARPIKNISARIELETKNPLKTIYSPSHDVEIKHDGAHRAIVGYESKDANPDADLQLFFSQEKGDLGLTLLTHKTSGEDGYFLLLASPAAELDNHQVMAKDVVFVLDTSGSMAGPKINQAKKALEFCVGNLNDADHFEVIRFSTETEPLFEKLTDATEKNRDRAHDFVKDLKAIGGTAINDALRKALSMRPEHSERPFFVIFLTDGLPTIGVTDEESILRTVKDGSGGQTRVFCFGIGSDVNTHLLDRIADSTKAISQYVLAEEDIEIKVSNFFTKIKEPVLASPKIEFPDGVRIKKLYPTALPDLFKGEQLVLVGRYSGSDHGEIQIKGKISGSTREFSYKVRFPEDNYDNEFIARLWATRRVGFLLDEIRLHGENRELRDECTDLARKYGIVTPYTAYLILEDEKQRGVPLSMQSLPDVSEDKAVAQQVTKSWSDLTKQKDGFDAVNCARHEYALKQANVASSAVRSGKSEGSRSLAGGPIVAAKIAPGSYAASADPVADGDVAQRFSDSTDRAQFAGGKNFFQNGSQWIDAETQSVKNAKHVRVQFNTKEYFDLAKNRKAAPWLALGQNVQFVLEGTVYEIYE